MTVDGAVQSQRPAGPPRIGRPRPGSLLIIGGGEDKCCGTGLLDRFVGLCGGDQAQIVLVTAAAGEPRRPGC